MHISTIDKANLYPAGNVFSGSRTPGIPGGLSGGCSFEEERIR
jgi:hypothetical protein